MSLRKHQREGRWSLRGGRFQGIPSGGEAYGHLRRGGQSKVPWAHANTSGREAGVSEGGGSRGSYELAEQVEFSAI